MSCNSEIVLMRQARAIGYKVNLAFVGLERFEMSVARVSMRVAEGGHDVPVEDATRRFDRVLADLPIALATSERAIVLDNSGRIPRLLMVAEAGKSTRMVGEPPGWLEDALSR
jgi:predicted ABC-type ATPase